MSALVWTSNFSSGSNTAKCKACDWTGNRHDSGAYGYGKAKAEADAHDAEHHAPEPEECEHGLSAWLCAGPMHYPADRESFF